MGKNKRRSVWIYDYLKKQDVALDSVEEWEFYHFCMECMQLGIVLQYDYQPITWILSERKTYQTAIPSKKEKFLLGEHAYSPDFEILFSLKHIETLSQYFKFPKTQIDQNGNPFVYVDTKGTFQRFGGDRAFSVNIKWVYDKYGLYVQKVVPKECFAKMGVPKECVLTRNTRKTCKKFVGMKTIPTIFSLK